jgi:hypothetical protein
MNIIHQKIGWPGRSDKFLETYYLPRLNHEEVENLIRSITNKGNESVTQNLPKKKCPGNDGFTNNF